MLKSHSGLLYFLHKEFFIDWKLELNHKKWVYSKTGNATWLGKSRREVSVSSSTHIWDEDDLFWESPVRVETNERSHTRWTLDHTQEVWWSSGAADGSEEALWGGWVVWDSA